MGQTEMAGLDEKELDNKYGHLPKNVKRAIVGGVDDFQSILAANNPEAVKARFINKYLEAPTISGRGATAAQQDLNRLLAQRLALGADGAPVSHSCSSTPIRLC